MCPEGLSADIAIVETSPFIRPGPGGGVQGWVDYYGFDPVSSAWYFVGWIGAQHVPLLAELESHVRVHFANRELNARGVVTVFYRADVGEMGSGFALYFPSHERGLGRLTRLEIAETGAGVGLNVDPECQHLRGTDLVSRLYGELSHAERPDDNRDELLALLTRKGFSGQETISALRDRVLLEIDHVIPCPPKGIALIGWMTAEPDTIRAVRLRSGVNSVVWSEANMIRLQRPDVRETFPRVDLNCGFVVWLELSVEGHQTYIEIETCRGEVGYKPVPAPTLSGIDAIKTILSSADLRFNELVRAFNSVLGPSVRSLQARRMRRRPFVSAIAFGDVQRTPRCSLIVPLHGRVDFLEYQVAEFCRHDMSGFELIYVLDDPPRRRELEELAESVYRRSRLPMRLLILDQNMGYAPSNNVGLAAANGEFVCFLNSDVFPDGDEWLDPLLSRLEGDPSLGAVGPVLLYDNGAVQHQGMQYEVLPAFGGWRFPIHERKGMKPPDRRDPMIYAPAITGACLVTRRALTMKFGGFEEGYVLGDFEDSDLCMQIARAGFRVGVDPAVRMIHLERKSQVGPDQMWRMNMTLYNAWLHQSRWFGA